MDKTTFPRHGASDQPEHNGFVLVAVLGLLLIASTVLLSFSISNRIYAQVANNALRAFQYERAAEAITQSVIVNQTPETIRRMLRTTQPSTMDGACLAGKHSISMRIQDHAGLIDLNAANEELLGIGYQALGFPERQSEQLAISTVAYRQSQGTKENYAVGGDLGAFGSKHSKFEDVAEVYDLSSIAGVSPANLYSTFTVLTHSGTLAEDAVSPLIRAALAARLGLAAPASLVPTAVPSAVTITVAIKQSEQTEIRYAVVFQFVADQPLFVQRIPGLEDQSEPNAPMGRLISCPQFLNSDVLNALTEMLP